MLYIHKTYSKLFFSQSKLTFIARIILYFIDFKHAYDMWNHPVTKLQTYLLTS